MWIEEVVVRLAEVYAGQPWYGKPLKTIFAEIDANKTGVFPGHGQHSLYQLVKHMLAWRTFVLERLKGNDAFKVEVGSEADWMNPAATTAADWEKLLAEFDDNQQALVEVLSQCTEESLNRPVNGKSYPFKKLVEGIVDHDIYHGGQLVTTARALGAYHPQA